MSFVVVLHYVTIGEVGQGLVGQGLVYILLRIGSTRSGIIPICYSGAAFTYLM